MTCSGLLARFCDHAFDHWGVEVIPHGLLCGCCLLRFDDVRIMKIARPTKIVM